MQYFSIGFAAAVPAGANPTPVPFALLTGLSLDIAVDYKQFEGNYLYTKAVGIAAVKATGKIDSANIYGGAMGLVLGASPAAGSKIPVIGEVKLGLAGGTYTVAQGATFDADFAVLDLTAGIQMQRVASAPASGQYSVNTATGVYTFNVADNGHNLSFTYTYTGAAVGKTTSVSNAVSGIASGFVLAGFAPNTNGKPLGVKLFQAFIPKLSLALKPDDFVMKSLDFFAAEDPATGKVMDIYTGD